MFIARKLGEKNWLAEASEEGLGSKRAVVPMMMMIGVHQMSSKPEFHEIWLADRHILLLSA
jgi:hypothetical protein